MGAKNAYTHIGYADTKYIFIRKLIWKCVIRANTHTLVCVFTKTKQGKEIDNRKECFVNINCVRVCVAKLPSKRQTVDKGV